ncbi:MAG: S-layer homology domain-containing protein [Clostridia bacterium]|nr:S-layer homology domain-containing protein [Clostridia bacterium]
MKKVLLVCIAAVLFGINVHANEWSNDDSIIRASVTYTDVDEGFWGYDAICSATRYGWFTGYSDRTFKPNDIITRAEAAKAVSNFLKLRTVPPIQSSYADVDTQSWYAPYVEAAGNLFYPTYGSEFKPAISITREDAMYLLVKAYGYDTLEGCVKPDILDGFSDKQDLNENISKAAEVAVYYGIAAGFSDATLRPGAELTRAQFATLLDRLYSIGPNRVPTTAAADHIELTVGSSVTVACGGRTEIRAELVYTDGKRIDYTNNLNIYTEDNEILKVVKNRIYGLKSGTGRIIFNNPAVSERVVTVNVEQ